jgi:hypothetical protein
LNRLSSPAQGYGGAYSNQGRSAHSCYQNVHCGNAEGGSIRLLA